MRLETRTHVDGQDDSSIIVSLGNYHEGRMLRECFAQTTVLCEYSENIFTVVSDTNIRGTATNAAETYSAIILKTVQYPCTAAPLLKTQ